MENKAQCTHIPLLLCIGLGFKSGIAPSTLTFNVPSSFAFLVFVFVFCWPFTKLNFRWEVFCKTFRIKWNKFFIGIFRSNFHAFFMLLFCVLFSCITVSCSFGFGLKDLFPLLQSDLSQRCLLALKVISQAVQGMWICMGGYRHF